MILLRGSVFILWIGIGLLVIKIGKFFKLWTAKRELACMLIFQDVAYRIIPEIDDRPKLILR